MSLKTRYATLSDLPEVYEMTLAGHKDLGGTLPETINPEKLDNWIYEAYRQAPCVLLEDKEIIGMWGLCTFIPKWSNDVVLGDYMLYIKPEHRSIKAIELLTQAVCDAADSFNLSLRLNYIIPNRFDAHKRLFERMGFEPKGIIGFYKGK